ncbi:MAG TPA: helix-turn-helix domain-containing protein [Ktedonobacterales bacterium]
MSEQNEMCQTDPPIEVFMINDLETLNVVADPLRVRILDLLRGQPQTVKQLNEVLRIGVSKLYYHVRLLEQHHLIRVYETRVVNGILEKHYQATAYKLSVDHALFSSSTATSSSTAGLDVFLSAVLDETRKDIQQSVREGLIELTDDAPVERKLDLGRCWARLSPAQAQQFRVRLDALMDEFLSLAPDHDSQELQWYEWLIGLYPTHTEPGAPRQGLDSHRRATSSDEHDTATEP